MSDFSKIKENRTFSYIYRRGKSFVHPYLVTYCVKKKSGGIRLGITTSKKIGNAVVRSRARRVITAAFRSAVKDIEGNYDFVLVARSITANQKSYNVEKVLRAQLTKAGILQGTENE